MATLQVRFENEQGEFVARPRSTNQTSVADVEFIFSEWMRLENRISTDGIHSVSVEDLRCTLRSPLENRGGSLIFGRQGFARIFALADLVAKSNKLQNRVSNDTLWNATSTVLLDRFLKKQISIDQRSVDRALSAAGKIARSRLVTKGHVLPCHLMGIEEPDLVEIGPVIFATRTTFRRNIVGLAKRYRKSLVGEEGRQKDKTFSDVLNYYRSFKWVGFVTIRNCDGATSNKYALEAVTAGLDCLHLLFGAGYSDRMRVGGPKIVADVRGRLQISEAGNLEVGWSRSVVGQVNFPEGWSSLLKRFDYARLLTLCGVAIETIPDPDLEWSLSQRFLDAAHWYGEAARESSAAAQVVKYVTALERMLMTDEMDDIASIVSYRASLFFSMTDSQSARSERQRVVKALYDLRSRLVHGSISPKAASTREGAALAARIVSETILSTLFRLGEDELLATKVSNKSYARWFKKFAEDSAEAAPSQRASVFNRSTCATTKSRLARFFDLIKSRIRTAGRSVPK